MSLAYLKNAVAIGNAKEAALYFDHVLPLDLMAGMTEREIKHSIATDSKAENILLSLLPNIGDSYSFYKGHIGISEAFWGIQTLRKHFQNDGSCMTFFDNNKSYVDEVSRVIKLTYGYNLDQIAAEIDADEFDFFSFKERTNEMMNNGILSLGMQDYSTWRDEHYTYGNGSIDNKLSDEESICIALNELDLIDADALSWTDILEIRNDHESLRELRDLRLFLHDNYQDKSPEYIRDAILTCVDRYNDRVRNLTLKTRKGYLSMLATKEGAAFTTLGAAITFMMTGVPLDPSLITAATVKLMASGGVVANIGGTASINYTQSKIDKSELMIGPDSQVRYITKVQKLAS